MPDAIKESAIEKPKIIVRVVLFCVLVALLVWALSGLLTPISKASGNDNAYKIYEQPENTTEVFFAGASTFLRGISPNKLYESYGIAAFNGATSHQPDIASLYALKDAMRSQNSSMRVVVVDAAPLLYSDGDKTLTQRAMAKFNDMEPSEVKLQFLMAAAQKTGESVNVFEELFPLIKYHSRWNKLEPFDFGIAAYTYRWSFSRGQNIDSHAYTSNVTKNRPYSYSDAKNQEIDDELSFPENTLEQQWSATNVSYFDDLVKYCEEHELEVMLLKLPMSSWGDLEHDSIKLLADRYEIPFLDMSQHSVQEECEYSYATDYMDDRHPNVFGGEKLSSYLGSYLSSHYSLSDVRLDPKFSFMEDDLNEYHRALNDAELARCVNLDDYIDLLDNDRYVAFITLKGAAGEQGIEGLGDATRAKLSAIGLKELAELERNESYVGVVSEGRVISEKTASDKVATIIGSFKSGRVLLKKQNLQPNAQIEKPLLLKSMAGADDPNATITVDGSELSENRRGLNIVVYDAKTGILLDTSSFDIYADAARTSDILPVNEPNGE